MIERNFRRPGYYASIGVGVLVLAMIIVAGKPRIAVAEEYPTKPIEIVIGFKAGGFTDAMARTLGEPLGEILGQTIVPVNKAGAGGGLAASDVAAAPPDGYKLVITSSTTFSFNPLEGNVTYSAADFDYLLTMARFETAFVAMADKGWSNLSAMLEDAKASGQPLRYATLTPPDRMQIDYVAKQSGVPIIPLPGKGGAGAMQMLLGGHVDFAFSGGIHQQYVDSGDMTVLAATGGSPLNSSPDAPTMADLGFPGITLTAVVAAPKGLTKGVRDRLEAALLQAANDPRFQELVKSNNVAIKPIGAEQSAREIMEAEADTRKLIE